jgi:hypothetical protein
VPAFRLVHAAAAIGVVAATALSLPTAATATAPMVRYATPHPAASATCAQTSPCDLVTAFNEAPANSKVVINSGTYGSALMPLDTMLNNPNSGIDAGGSNPASPPLIYNAQRIATGTAGHMHNLSVVYSGPGAAVILNNQATLQAANVTATANSASACALTNATVLDSVCLATGQGGSGVFVGLINQSSVVTEAATLRGDTVEAAGVGGVAIEVDAGAKAHITLTATNVIAHGTAEDIEAGTNAASSIATVDTDHSDYSTTDPSGPGSAAIPTNASNIATAPVFVNAAAFNYREKAGSPTINKGTTDPVDTDLAGHPRSLGSAPDMGAYEFLPKPTTPTVKVASKTQHTAHVTVAVNPEGLTTHVVLTATHGKVHITPAAKSAGSGRRGKAITITLRGLKPHTKYHIHAVATNAGGHATSATKSLTTKKPKKHHHTK